MKKLKKVLSNLWNDSSFALGVLALLTAQNIVTLLFNLFSGDFYGFLFRLVTSILLGAATYFIYEGVFKNDDGK